MIGYISPITTCIEEFLDQPTFLNICNKLNFYSNDTYSCALPKYFSEKFMSRQCLTLGYSRKKTKRKDGGKGEKGGGGWRGCVEDIIFENPPE